MRTTSHTSTRARTAVAGLVLAMAAVAAACTAAPGTGTGTTLPPVPAPPTITAFVAVGARTEAPVTKTLIWNISDPNGDALTCRVDTDGDGEVDRTITSCDNTDTVNVTYTGEGPWFPTVEVDDVVTGSTSATTQVDVTPGPAEPFQITLSLAPTMQPQFRAACEAAAARWSQVLVAGLSDPQLTLPQDFLGWVPAFDGYVDDVLIAARDFDIDGTGGTLGRAGALLTRETGGQAYFGIMEFDTADLSRLATSGRLQSVILHEMGHVLGIGADWALKGFIDDLLTDPAYNGAAGVSEWRAMGRSGKPPIENSGGAGTAIGHWRESVFNNELMTGYSDFDERLSRLTVAALADQGYGVNFAAADPYTLPGAASRAPSAPEEHQHTERVAPLPGNQVPTS